MSLKLGNTTIAGISRETKLNAHSLLDFKWADHILNEMSWLRADTFSWQSGDVYTSVYNLLVAEYQNGTEETEGSITFKRSPNGYKITTDESGTSELYNNVGVAWYYILDITNRRFKLPRTKYGFDGISTKVGDFVSDMLQGHSHIVFQEGGNAPSNVVINSKSLFGANSKNNNTNAIKGVITDPSYGTVRIGSETRQKATQMYLYFYVGEFSQTATEQTAGITMDIFNNKADTTLSNINASASAKEMIVGWGMPDFNSSIGFGSPQGFDYTAPVNGCVTLICAGGTNGYPTNITVNNIPIAFPDRVGAGEYKTQLYIPLSKGDRIIGTTTASAFYTRIFLPFKGAN